MIGGIGATRSEVFADLGLPCQRTHRGSHAVVMAQQRQDAMLRNESGSPGNENPYALVVHVNSQNGPLPDRRLGTEGSISVLLILYSAIYLRNRTDLGADPFSDILKLTNAESLV